MNRFVFAFMLVLTLPLVASARHPSSRRHSPKIRRVKHSVLFLNEHNTLQVESYINFENNNGVVTASYPSLLLRYGILNRLELRLAFDLATIKDFNLHSTRTGFTPLQPGFKVRFNEPRKFLPAFGFTGSVIIPMAASPVMKQTYFAPSLIFSAEQDITKELSFEYTAGMQWDADNFQRIYTGSVNFEYDMAAHSTFYGDFYLFKPEKDAIDLRADVGFNQTITSNLQFDISLGSGLTTTTPEFFLSAGLQFSVAGHKTKTTVPSLHNTAPVTKPKPNF